MSWSNGVIVLLLTAGFAKLSTMIVNWLLAIPQPKYLIGATEIVQISLIVVYFTVMLNRAWGHGSGQFTMDAPFLMTAVGAIGFLLLCNSTIAWHRYRPPACQISNESTVIDFRTDDGVWKTTLVGPRPMRRIALLPGNEQFTIEVSTRSFVMPKLPKEWDGLSIVHLADSHFRGAAACAWFEAVCARAADLKPDLYIFTGDLLDDPTLLNWFQSTFGQLKAPYGQYFILGNHDWYLDAPAVRKEFERHGWIDLSGRCMDLASTTSGAPPIVLAGDESPWMGKHPDMTGVPDGRFRILLSHTPDNITWAREHCFDLMLAGHTHGGQICLPVLGPVYSPSRFGCRFASGAFWRVPTLLYVSRGLSGREPIRYNCRPELTKFVLRNQYSIDHAAESGRSERS